MVLAIMRPELVRLHAVLVSSLLAVLGSACATGPGPKALRNERPDCNQQIVRSADAELLPNLVRPGPPLAGDTPTYRFYPEGRHEFIKRHPVVAPPACSPNTRLSLPH
jgi:hypothetical protein